MSTHRSPYRIRYGVHNPAGHGVIVAPDTVIPNFSYTPCLAPKDVDAVIKKFSRKQELNGDSLILLPSVAGQIIRLFIYYGEWYIATSHFFISMDSVNHPLVAQFIACIETHLPTEGGERKGARLIQKLEECDSDGTMVWFFAIYPERRSVLYLGSCQRVTPVSIVDELCPNFALSFDFRHAAPKLPLPCIPSIDNCHQSLLDDDYVIQRPSLTYHGLFNGIFVCNPRTMFAVQICTPRCIFLRPILDHQMSIAELLVLRKLQSKYFDGQRLGVDPATRNWFAIEIPWYVNEFFQDNYTEFMGSVSHKIETVHEWLPEVLYMDAHRYPPDPELYPLHCVLASPNWLVKLRHPKYHWALVRVILGYIGWI